jgi:hypothetical protein
VAIFLDGGLLTELRTAAAGAAAARLLSPDLLGDGGPTSSGAAVGVVGTGTQARHQLRYLKCVTDCRGVWECPAPLARLVLKCMCIIRHELDVGLADVREELDEDGALLFYKVVIL